MHSSFLIDPVKHRNDNSHPFHLFETRGSVKFIRARFLMRQQHTFSFRQNLIQQMDSLDYDDFYAKLHTLHSVILVELDLTF